MDARPSLKIVCSAGPIESERAWARYLARRGPKPLTLSRRPARLTPVMTRPRVEMMQGQSTGKRLALLVVIVARLLGAPLLL